MKQVLTVFLMLLAFMAGTAHADASVDKIRTAMKKLVPDTDPDAITPSKIPGMYEVRYGMEVVYVSEDGKFLISGSLIDTESGNNSDAGNIYLGTASGLNIYANAIGYDLALNTTTGAGYHSGNIGVGLIDNNAGGNSHINDLTINALGGGADPFENCGLVSLKGNIYVDDDGAGNPGSVTIGGRVKYMTSVTIDTEQGGDTNGGIINMPYANTAANAASSYDLSIDTSTVLPNGDGGDIVFYKCGQLGGQAFYVRNLIMTSAGSGAGQAGDISITGGNNTAGTQTYTTGPGGTVTLSGNLGATNQDITFSADTPVVLGAPISINTGTGTITFNSTLAAGNYDLTLTADGIDFLGGNNSVTGSGDISLSPSN